MLWKGWCEGDSLDEKWIIMELVKGKNIDSYLHPKEGEEASIPLSFRQKMDIARDIALGMRELHTREPPIVYVLLSASSSYSFIFLERHLDLKPENLMMDSTGVTKIAGTCAIPPLTWSQNINILYPIRFWVGS